MVDTGQDLAAQEMADLDVASGDRRVRRRRTVLWPAELFVRGYRFKCQVLNMSLQGARIRLDLPIAEGTEATLSVLGRSPLAVRICWAEVDSLGLEFQVPSDTVRRIFLDRMAVLGLDELS